MIDALEVLHAAAVVQTDQRAAMRAAVLERDDLTVPGARHHHRHGADERGAVVAHIGKLGLEAQEVPDGTFEYALLLEGEDVRIG